MGGDFIASVTAVMKAHNRTTILFFGIVFSSYGRNLRIPRGDKCLLDHAEIAMNVPRVRMRLAMT